MPPLAASGRLLPSSHQLVHRLSQLAKGYDLNIPPDAQNEIGEFLSVGVDAHMGDILHAHVHLTGRDRPGFKTIHVRPGTDSHDEYKMEPGELDGEVPPAELDSLRALVDLYPRIHAATSPALFKLGSGVTSSERDYNAPLAKGSRMAKTAGNGLGDGYARIGAREKNEDPALILGDFLG
jgi:transcriptional coactivator HFI1/ADA1